MMSETHDVLDSPVGSCAVVMRAGRVCRVLLGVTARLPGRRADLAAARRWVAGWFAGRPSRVPMDLSGVTPFARRVYDVVKSISRGATLTYGEVARRAGRPGAARAVGRAMGRNPIPLFIP